jgi:mitochondrial fission protein ELM1
MGTPNRQEPGNPTASAGRKRAPLRTIRVLSDGRRGHENQSVGLATALAARTGATVEITRLPEPRLSWILRFPRAIAGDKKPELLIGAGHRTHLPMAFAAWRLGAKSVVIMKPTWPKRLFDLCLIPAHDIRRASANVITTRGALNRIPETIPAKQARGMILIGGPSKHHGWEAGPLTEAIRAVLHARPDLTWVIGDSFRTPDGFLMDLQASKIPAEFVSHSQTAPGWVPAQLLTAREVWVTEDSISMLHESATAQAQTGILPMPMKKGPNRVGRAIELLIADGYATRYATWMMTSKLPPPRPMHETGRCADIILDRLFAGQSTPPLHKA